MRRIVWIAVVAACGGGSSGVGSPCHESDTCADQLFCAGPNDPPVCGIAPREQCATDVDCAGQRCHAIGDSCSPDGIGSECRAACTGDPECGAGFHCDNGACAANICGAGSFSCPVRQTCDPSRIAANAPVHMRTHGCFDITCSSDAGCGARFCVNGVCQDAVGTCQKPMLVP